MEYKVDERGLSVSFCQHCLEMSLGLSDEDYEFDTETKERKPNIDLREILNPTIIWAFPNPHPEYVRAYWFRKETPDERSLTFVGFAESKRDCDALYWLTEKMHAHLAEEKKKVSGVITIDDVVEKMF